MKLLVTLALVTALIPSLATSQENLLDGIVAFYGFSGNANDESGNGHHGIVDGPLLTIDRFGTQGLAFEFDGFDDIIHILDDPHFDTVDEFSLSAWIRPAARKTQTILHKGTFASPPYSLSLSGTGDFVLSLKPSGIAIQVRAHGYEINIWTFVAATWDGNRARLYVNGEEVASEVAPGTIYHYNAPLRIGTRLQMPANSFEGVLDEITVYERALTADEVMELGNGLVSVEYTSWSQVKSLYR